MNTQLTLVTVLLVLLIIAELVSLYTNGIIMARNYSNMKEEIKALRETNKLISGKYKELTDLLMTENKIAGYVVDARGVTYLQPDDYQYITRTRHEVKDENEDEK